MKKICGIYKITSPNNRVYIGQSRNINQRFIRYKKNHKSNETQIRLIRSFNKYGVENHTFEIIEECMFEHLNIRERYWQDFYNVLDEGLNCILTETDILPRVQSEETRIKRSGKNHWAYGKKFSEETIQKFRDAKKNMSEEHKNLLKTINLGNKYWVGKKHKEESKLKQSESAKTRKTTPENETKRRQGIGKGLSKIVLKCDLNDNLIQEYSSVTEAAKDMNSQVGSIVHAIQRKRVKKHKGFKWKYKE